MSPPSILTIDLAGGTVQGAGEAIQCVCANRGCKQNMMVDQGRDPQIRTQFYTFKIRALLHKCHLQACFTLS